MTADRADGSGAGDRPDRDAEPIARRNEWSGPAPRLADMTHVHADHDPRAWHWFARGPPVADGGDRADDPASAERGRAVEDEQLRDVAHEPAAGDGANRVWDRGERREDGV